MDNLANLIGMKAEDKGLELLFDIAAGRARPRWSATRCAWARC